MRGSAAFRAAIAPGGVLAGPWVRNDLWRRARAVPSLDLQFADTKSLTDAVTGQSLVTFTRASSATYTGSDGLIKTATTNLLLRSEEFDNASWGKTGLLAFGSGSTANVIAAPNATVTADLITEDTSTGTHALNQSATITAGATLQTSVYVRPAAGTRHVRLQVTSDAGANGFRAYFDLSQFSVALQTTLIGTGSAVSNSAVITSVGNGWYRVSCAGTVATAATSITLNLFLQPTPTGSASYTGDGTSGIYIWGAQLEQSSTVGEYIPTTSTINSAPRFDHNPTTGESLGLLVEEQRTNSIRNNTMVGAVAGTPGTAPTTWNVTAATDLTRTVVGTGTENGVTYVDFRFTGTVTAARSQYIFLEGSAAIAASNNQPWAGSAWVKVAGGSLSNITSMQLQADTRDSSLVYVNTPYGLNIYSSVSSVFTRFNASGNTAAANVAYIQPFLVFTTATSGAVDITLRIGLPQLEQGAFATSVIPTLGTATATRSADVSSISGNNFGVTTTNLLTRTEEFDNATWTLGAATVTPNAITAPNGSLTADQLIETTATANHEVSQSFTPSANTSYTLSCYLKAATSSTCGLRFSAGLTGSGVICSVDLVAKTATITSGIGTATIVTLADGWFRVSLTATASASPSSTFAYVFRSLGIAGSTSSSIYTWGAQLETGSVVSTYLPSQQTFTSRASSATYFDPQGILRTQGYNLLLRSEALATSPWFSANVTLTNNTSDVSDPAGGLTATKIVATGSASSVGQSATISAASTGSIWLRTASGTANFTLIIYLSASPFTNIGTASITVTTTWQRFTVTSSLPPSVASYNFQLNTIPATTVYAWGAQLEQSSTAGEYSPTTTAANSAGRTGAFLPDSAGVFRSAGPLLLEEARTNSIRNNTMVGAVAGTPGTLPTNWTGSLAGGISREVVGTGIANGINYIDLRIFGTATNTNLAINLAFEGNVIAAASGQSWTESMWVSMVAGSTTGINYIQPNITERSAAAADLAYNNGANFVSTISSFLRRTHTVTLGNASTAYAVPTLWVGHTGVGAVIDITLRIGLPQLEQGAFATSVIPTFGTAAVTRSADVSSSITGTAFSSWYRQDEGTVFASAQRLTNGTDYNRLLSFNTATANDIWSIYCSANKYDGYKKIGSGADNFIGGPTVGTLVNNHRVVVATNASEFVVSTDGALGSVTSIAGMPAVNRLAIGSEYYSAPYNGTIRRLCYWGQRLPNTTLQAITQ